MKSKRILVSYYVDCYYGTLEGLFVTTKESLENAYGREVYFGEVLGKHSEVTDTLDENSFDVVSESEEFIRLFESNVGVSFGCNPFDYIGE